MKPVLDLVPVLLRTLPLPESIHAGAVALAVSHLLRGQPLAAQLGELAGKRFRLCIDDVPLAMTFEITATGLRRSTLPAHVTMRGALSDFIALARRQEDPDTLFFQRRLAVEGETETGLHLKNLLDGWEYDVPAHVHAVMPPVLAHFTLAAARGARALHGLSLLRRPGSRRSNLRAETARGR
jgi:predicted lipid carrier protein YhbT